MTRPPRRATLSGMADFRTHITVSSILGVGVGAAAVQPFGFPTETAVLAAALTAVGGMLPDLDSDSGVPVRELFALAAVMAPLVMIPRLIQMGLTREGVLASMLFGYILIRYWLRAVFKRLTVHRGMFHSLPAMLVAGLVVYLGYHSDHRPTRLLFGFGVMAGFLSHLVLDELYAVDLRGLRVKLNKFAGSAVKLFSPSMPGTAACYAVLGALLYLAYLDFTRLQASSEGVGR
ncbi:MAG: metal-dependent hydrolase [Gemmataceae bacterium]